MLNYSFDRDEFMMFLQLIIGVGYCKGVLSYGIHLHMDSFEVKAHLKGG